MSNSATMRQTARQLQQALLSQATNRFLSNTMSIHAASIPVMYKKTLKDLQHYDINPTGHMDIIREEYQKREKARGIQR